VHAARADFSAVLIPSRLPRHMMPEGNARPALSPSLFAMISKAPAGVPELGILLRVGMWDFP
jgi:hypothetical protein